MYLFPASSSFWPKTLFFHYFNVVGILGAERAGIPKSKGNIQIAIRQAAKNGKNLKCHYLFFFIALSKINWINKRVESFIYFLLLVHTHFSCSKNTPFFLDSQHSEDAKSVSTVTTFAMYHHFQLWHDRSWRLSCLLTLTLILHYSLFHWQIRTVKSHPTLLNDKEEK